MLARDGDEGCVNGEVGWLMGSGKGGRDGEVEFVGHGKCDCMSVSTLISIQMKVVEF